MKERMKKIIEAFRKYNSENKNINDLPLEERNEIIEKYFSKK